MGNQTEVVMVPSTIRAESLSTKILLFHSNNPSEPVKREKID